MSYSKDLQPLLAALAPKWSQPLTGPGSRNLQEWLASQHTWTDHSVQVTGMSVAGLVQWCTDHGVTLDMVKVDYAGCGSHAVALVPTDQPTGGDT